MHYRATLYCASTEAEVLYSKARALASSHRLQACSPKERASRRADSIMVWLTNGEGFDFCWAEATRVERGETVVLNIHCTSAEQLVAFLKTTTELADWLEASFKIETTPDPEEPWKDDLASFRFWGVRCVGLRGHASSWFAHYARESGLTLKIVNAGQTRCFCVWSRLVSSLWAESEGTRQGIETMLEPDPYNLAMPERRVDTWARTLLWDSAPESVAADVGHVWGIWGALESAQMTQQRLAEVCALFGMKPAPLSAQHPASWVLPALAHHTSGAVSWELVYPGQARERLEANSAVTVLDPANVPANLLQRASLASVGFARYQGEALDMLVRCVAGGLKLFIAQPEADFSTPASDEEHALVLALAHRFEAQVEELDPWS